MIGAKVGNAFVKIDVPLFHTTHNLFLSKDGLRWALLDTHLTKLTEVVNPNIDRAVQGHRQLGQDRS
jgi:hypothetical protein